MINQKSLDSIPAILPSPLPNPEVVAQAQRRRFTAEYKLRILTASDQDFAGLGLDGAHHEDERFWLMDGQIERAQGRDGAFANLTGGDRNDAGIGAIEHGGLLGARLEPEFFTSPGRRRQSSGDGARI